MGPPRGLDGWMIYDDPDDPSPLRNWTEVAIFDAAEDCGHEEWREKNITFFELKRPDDSKGMTKELDRYWAKENWIMHLRCVASDDPRLVR